MTRLFEQAVIPRDEKHLPDNFAGGQVALEPHQRGHAELTIDWTTNLRRNANRVATRFGHENSFDSAPVLKLEQIALRAVGRFIAPRELGKPDNMAGGEVPAQRRGQRRDAHQVVDALAVQRMINLAGAKFRLLRP
jgi:hypothetical protein